MTERDDDTQHSVANPERTNIAEPADREGQLVDEPEPTKQDPTDQPWPEVAEEVKRAVEDAEGPLER